MPDGKRKRNRKPTGRKGGGQPGNKNALRHAFYAETYTIKEGQDLKDSLIEDELDVARVKARRLAKLTPLTNPNAFELSILFHFNNLLITINTIERTRLLARGHGGEIGQTILEALRELNPHEEL